MSYDSGILRDRVSQLDAAHRGPPSVRRLDPLASDITHFIRTLSRVTPVDRTRFGTLPVISPRDADEIVADCGLLGRVQSERADLVIGPIDRDNQYWVSVERMPHQAPRERHLDVSHFNGLPGARAPAATTKPSGLGLFTSTGSADSFGMWWSYLQEYRGSTLFPEPWIVWRVGLAPTSRVLEISTAAQWVALAEEHRREDQRVVYPNWQTIGERWDGVHLTMSAVAATQGICLSARDGVVAPTYWDVESTLWLRWVVDGASQVARTAA